ncbi:thiamine transporter 1-like [Xenia sp. Carnegie-2017]|uniref:thiamine transporter 1-like n=1 Tax=Xenia sp. Carnegie-2017 TaxID=2897299 RepID=UPI001F04036D|nr:thiamine transporter 1-like [Xenia sp. Carnegie-2017]
MWLYQTILLCCYGFFKEMKPSESFLTPYLREAPKNFTETQLVNDIYPVSTYANLVALFLVFFLTDFLRYKPVIIFEALSYIATRVLLIWGTSVLAMQWMQVAYGFAVGAEVAYYSYIYAAVSLEHYQKVTSFTRAAILLGRMVAGLLGQLLISLNVTGYLTLNYISFGSVLVSFCFSLILPRVSSSASAFNTQFEDHSKFMQVVSQWKAYLVDFAYGFKNCYTRRFLLKWSLWWAFATCGELQVENYVQNLWDEIFPSHEHKIYNGGVTALSHLFASTIAVLLAFTKINWSIWGELCLAVFSIIDCFLLFFMSATSNIWLAYSSYVLFRIIYTFLITIASLQIAKMTEMNRFGLVFGCNMFAALVLQTILTAIVAEKSGLALPVKEQFVVYGFYFYIIGAAFLANAVYYMTVIGWRICWQRRYYSSINNDNESRSDESSKVEESKASINALANLHDPTLSGEHSVSTNDFTHLNVRLAKNNVI